ncbi:MAG: cation diffusion facilitator family transporter [Promethearchaeota archaeon]
MKKDQKVLIGAAGVDSILVLLKIVTGVFTGSLGLISDGLHSFVDILVRIAGFLGVTLSQRPKSKKFPLGLHKIEDLVALGVSLLILLLGVNTGLIALKNLFNDIPELQSAFLGLFFAIFAAGISFGMSLLLVSTNRNYDSPILHAVSQDYRMDSLVTFGVICGLGLSIIGFPIADSLVSLIISILVLFEGFLIAKDAILTLLDASLDLDTLNNLKKVVEDVQQISIEDIIGRRAGRFLIVSLTVNAPPTFDLKRIQLLIDELETKISKKVPKIAKLSIIVKPPKKGIVRIAIPLENNEGLNSRLSKHFGGAPFFAFLSMKYGKTTFLNIEKNPYMTAERKRGVKTVQFIIGQKIDAVYSRVIPKKTGAGYALGDAGISIEKTNVIYLQDAKKELEDTQSER